MSTQRSAIIPASSGPVKYWPEAATAFLICALATTIALIAAGRSLGLVFGGQFIAVLVIPPLTAGRPRQRMPIAYAAVGGIALVWLCLIGPNKATAFQWASITLILAALAITSTGLSTFLERLRFPTFLASALNITFMMTWLTWPIWLPPQLTNVDSHRLIDCLVQIHPPLASNGILTFTPPWTEQTIAYHLTILDQDVPIRLPATAWPSILAHFLLGTVLLAVIYRKSESTSGAKTAAENRQDMGPT